MRTRSASVSDHFALSLGSAGQAQRRRVLTVEDDCVNNLFVQSLLQAFGVEKELMDHAVNADEAIKLAYENKGRYSFVLMDLCLKDSVSGFEITSSIRSFDAETPIVIVSVMDDTVSRTKAIQAGARGFMPKPVTASAIQELLRTCSYPLDNPPNRFVFDPCIFREASPRSTAKMDPLEVMCASNDVQATAIFVKSALNGLHNALLLAAKRGFSEICTSLLRLIAEREDLGAPLHAAIVEGHSHIVQVLLAGGVPINWACKETRNTALHVCCRQGNAELCHVLLQCKADVNCMSLNGYTPLHVAAWSGSVACVKLLLAHGADVHVESKTGFGVIDVTADLEIVAFLLSKGCNMKSQRPNAPNAKQRVPRERSVSCTPRQFLKMK